MGNNEIDEIELREIGCSRYLRVSREERYNEAMREKENEDDNL